MANSNFKKIGQISALAMATILMVGCASTPVGPSLTVMPAPGKPFDVFKNDDKECREYAQNSLNTTADEIAAKNTAKTAVVGAVLGAVAGAVPAEPRVPGRIAAQTAGRGLRHRGRRRFGAPLPAPDGQPAELKRLYCWA